MYRGKVLSIDLDETLGYFRDVEPFARSKKEAKQGRVNVTVRPDLSKALESFRSQGARTAISSGRTIHSILSAVRYGHIQDLFDMMFGGYSLDYDMDYLSGGGKDYRVVAKYFRIPAEHAPSDMIIFGDDEGTDAPKSLSGVVFVYQPDGYITSALMWETIATALLKAGNGSFNSGFQQIFENAQVEEKAPPLLRETSPLEDAIKRHELGNVTLYLQTRSTVSQDIRTPTIYPVLRTA